jgi:hypothetical protein
MNANENQSTSKLGGWVRLYIALCVPWLFFQSCGFIENLPQVPTKDVVDELAMVRSGAAVDGVVNISDPIGRITSARILCDKVYEINGFNTNECIELITTPGTRDIGSIITQLNKIKIPLRDSIKRDAERDLWEGLISAAKEKGPRALAVASIPPIILLLLGFVVSWVRSGFIKKAGGD